MIKEPITIKGGNEFWLVLNIIEKNNEIERFHDFLYDSIEIWLSNRNNNYIKCDFINKGSYLLFHCKDLKCDCYDFHLSLNNDKTVFYEKDILNIFNDRETNIKPLKIDGGNYKIIL